MKLNTKNCWRCKYFEYEEHYDPETGGEEDYMICSQGRDARWVLDEPCELFEERWPKKDQEVKEG